LALNRPARGVPRDLPLIQFVERPGIIDLGWGHPDPTLVPVDALRSAAARAFDRYGPDALAYGAAAGPGPLIEAIRDRLLKTDLRAPAGEEVLISGGTSPALDQVATLMTVPGDVVLVEVPTYHLAIRIFRDHPLRLVPIASDADGLRIDALAEALRNVRRAGDRPRLLYTVPTHHNPSGRTMPGPRRAELVALAEQEGIVIVEDDAYRELSYDAAPPPSLWSLSRVPGAVVRLGTFAKSIAPGIRVGFVTADAATISRFAEGGMLDSGGGANHFAGLVVAEYMRSGDYARVVDLLRDAFRERRDQMLQSLAAEMPPGTSWTRPAGGYFIWVDLPPGLDARALLPLAEASGTSILPGPTFFLDPAAGTESIRVAFSRYTPATLGEAVARLAASMRTLG
jgi:DNA-binding transcriptional MocR family regulator